jgi:hypothetical protein
LQALVTPAGTAGFVPTGEPVCAGEPVIGTQVFRQNIACVSQLIWHVSVVVFKVGGVMGTGFTV